MEFYLSERMNYVLNNSFVDKALALGAQKNVKQIIIAEDGNGDLMYRGDLDIRVVVKKLQDKVHQEDALRGEWMASARQTLPKLPRQLNFLLKTPRMVKTAVAASLNHLMDACGVKLGRGTFLLWHYPIEKVFLTNTVELVKNLPDVFTLSMIIDWSDLKGTSISNGRLGAIKVK